MIYQLKSYSKHLLRSTNAHGIHSPFVYDLVTNCFYDNKTYPEYALLRAYRKELTTSKEIFDIQDFGAGSRVFTSPTRKVSAIAKNAGIPEKRQQLLFRLSAYFQPQTSVELGTSLGLGTVALALGNPTATITTVEGCPNTARIAMAQFRRFNLNTIEVHNSTFETFLAENTQKTIHFAYIDGNHNKENTLHYFELLSERASNESIFIFDDIYWSKAMTEAWEEIKAHPKVTVSIDTFQWGIVFFRKEQEKEHFYIRV